MHHICTGCNSPFLLDSDSATAGVEAVVTTCGHVFHRDCVELLVASRGAKCPLCSSSMQRNAGKLIKIYLSYDEDAYDHVLLRDVQNETAKEKKALDEQPRPVGLERRRQLLHDQHTFNRNQVTDLLGHVAAVESFAELYKEHLEIIEQEMEIVEDEYEQLKRQLQNSTGRALHTPPAD
ncbi:hypothetical protein C8Q77DRAFT_1068570 [Trametes polyzona]|nr:hypothetical protein C8Q77DRAFT_1068570 [Trametes polyzona]